MTLTTCVPPSMAGTRWNFLVGTESGQGGLGMGFLTQQRIKLSISIRMWWSSGRSIFVCPTTSSPGLFARVSWRAITPVRKSMTRQGLVSHQFKYVDLVLCPAPPLSPQAWQEKRLTAKKHYGAFRSADALVREAVKVHGEPEAAAGGAPTGSYRY